MIYFDAAYIAKFYLNEPESDAVRTLAESAGAVACCAFGQVETVSVFHRKLREGLWDGKVFEAVCSQFRLDCAARVWSWLPVTLPLLEQTVERLRALPQNV